MLETATIRRLHARRWLKAYCCSTCSTAAFIATSSIRFFESPTAALPCPGSDPPPACGAACSHPATAWLPEPRLHPSRHTSPSRHRSCASILQLPVPRLQPSGPPPPASAQQSSAPPCACSSTSPPLFQNTISYSVVCGFRGAGQPVVSVVVVCGLSGI